MDSNYRMNNNMRISYRQKINIILVVFISVITVMSSESYGKLNRMNDNSMKETVGQAGFTDFSMVDNTARLFVDIHIETIGTIEKFYLGAPSDYDLQFDNIELGDAGSDTPLTIDGLVFIADFDTSKNLERLVIGSNMLNGAITANMNSYSGVYNENLIPGVTTGVAVEQDSLPVGTPDVPTTFDFNDDGLFFVLSNTPGISGTETVGFRMVAGYDETTIGTSNWWDYP